MGSYLFEERFDAMACPVRIEFPHAIDHGSARSHTCQHIVTTDGDRQAYGGGVVRMLSGSA